MTPTPEITADLAPPREITRRTQVPLWRKLRSFGTGIGIEILPASLKVCLLDVRPGGIRIKDNLEILNFRSRPAAEWGNEYQTFLDKHKQRHQSACVLLPAGESINRVLNLPGVAEAEIEAAVRYQLDGLHPYPEEDVFHSWSALPVNEAADKKGALLIAIAQQSVINEYATIFEESGIAVAAFTTVPAAIYSALRVLQDTPADAFLALHEDPRGLHLYGESATHPIFFAQLQQEPERALHFASSQLRLPEDAIVSRIAPLLPVTLQGEPASAYAYAAALQNALPGQGLSLNLLPAERRKLSSRLRWVPTLVLLLGLLAVGLALAYYQEIENRALLAKMREEITRLEPSVRRVESLEAATAKAQAKLEALQALAEYPRQDLELLRELTRLIAPPAWLGRMDMTRSSVSLGGEIDQAADLLRQLDASPLLSASEFSGSTGKTADNREVFNIRSNREFPGAAPAANAGGSK
jgi:Tfp pilus assembly protein PilN